MIQAYPKIWSLGTKYVDSIFYGEVEITEKIDGSQFTFGRINGELFARSKGKEMRLDAPEKMFQAAADHVMNLAVSNRIPNDLVFHCEYLRQPKHNVLTYDSIPRNHLALFGMSTPDRDWMNPNYRDLSHWANELGISVVPLLHYGTSSPEHAMSLIERESVLGGPNVEGVVIKAYKDCIIADQVFPVMSAKYVSEKFKEKHASSWKKDHTSKGGWNEFVESYRTEARWQKAVQHLRDDGVLQGEPRDIGALIKATQADILEEESDAIKAYLWKTFSPELLRRSIAGLPEWYKEQIAKGEIS